MSYGKLGLRHITSWRTLSFGSARGVQQLLFAPCVKSNSRLNLESPTPFSGVPIDCRSPVCQLVADSLDVL